MQDVKKVVTKFEERIVWPKLCRKDLMNIDPPMVDFGDTEDYSFS